MPLATGYRLGSYEVVAPIGAGNMGEIYQAFDANLKRDVAIKVLPDHLSEDPDRLARFQREAYLLASVNHPNIASIHNLEEAAGRKFLVLELIEGRTLAEAISATLPAEDALELSRQVAEALEAAHQAGIIHRDLKPANIMVTSDGRAKVLDFGLAQVMDAGSERMTGAAKLTTTGMIVGTPPYMSPEQLRDQPLDARTDIWAFGCILYEALTGTLAFDRGSVGDTVNAILEHEPDWSALPASTPMAVVTLLRRCLQKDATSRLADIRDARTAIDDVLASSPDALPTAAMVRDSTVDSAGGTGYLKAGLGVAAIAVLVWLGARFLPAPPQTRDLPAASHRQMTFVGDATDAAISPDGASVVYVRGTRRVQQQLMLADVAGGQPIEILSGRSIHFPVWSPDGSSLTVGAARDQPAPLRVYRVPRLGGEPRRLGRGAYSTWSPDGSRVAFTLESPTGFSVFSMTSGATEFVPLEGYDFNYGLSWSPDGDRLALLTGTTASGTFEIVSVAADGDDPTTVVSFKDRLSSPRWSPDGGAIYFMRHVGNLAELVRVEIASDGEPRGEPAVVLSGLQPGDSFNFSADGRTLAYSRRLETSNLWTAEITPSESSRSPSLQKLTSTTSRVAWPSYSPDGEWIAFSTETSTGANIFKIRADGGTPTQLTFSQAHQTGPAWSPDGASIVFSVHDPDLDAPGAMVWSMESDGSRPRPLERTRVSTEEMGLTWSPGRNVLYERPGNRSVSILDVQTQVERSLLVDEDRGWVFSPKYSPDATEVAVYVNRPPRGGGLAVVTLEPYAERVVADEPLDPIGWSPDGAWIYVVRPRSNLVGRVSALGGSGDLEILFELPGEALRGSVSPSGTALVVPVSVAQSDVFLVDDFDHRGR